MKKFYSRISKKGLLFSIRDFSIFKICSEVVNISVGHPVLITNLEINGLKFLEAENILRLKFLEAESVSRP